MRDSDPLHREADAAGGGKDSAPTALLVLGMHRSGTSALTRTMNLLGAALPGSLIPASAANESGFWESADIQRLNDRILAAMGSRWDDWRPLAQDALVEPVRAAFADEALALLQRDFSDTGLFVVKDPRMCRLLPFWREVLERFGARICCVLPLRSPLEVAASLQRRNGFGAEKGTMLWLRHVLDAEHASRDLPRAIVTYEALLADWRGTIATLEGSLDLRFPHDAATVGESVDSFLQQRLRHHAAERHSTGTDAGLARWVQEAADALSACMPDAAATEPRQRLDRLRDEVARASELLAPLLDEAARPRGSVLRAPTGFAARLDPHSVEAAALRVTEAARDSAQQALEAAGGAKAFGRFSIVMPTWNRRATLDAAIESVLAQSWQDWELIICDDGSTDGTGAHVHERFAAEMASGRLRYLELAHRGVGAARNAGLRVANGEWIAYLDSDNRWHADYLLMTAAGYAANPHRRTAYACMHVHDEAEGSNFIRSLPFVGWERLLQGNFIDLNVFSHNRDVYQQLGGFDESLRRLVDWQLILRYTRLYAPLFNPFILCDYFISPALDNITLTEALEAAETAVRASISTNDIQRRDTASAPRLAYLMRDWPESDERAELEVIRELRDSDIAVRVYYLNGPGDAARDLPEVPVRQVPDTKALVRLIHAEETEAAQRDQEIGDAAAARLRETMGKKDAALQQKDLRIATLEKVLEKHRARVETLEGVAESRKNAIRERDERIQALEQAQKDDARRLVELESNSRAVDSNDNMASLIGSQVHTGLLARKREHAAAALAARVALLHRLYGSAASGPRWPRLRRRMPDPGGNLRPALRLPLQLPPPRGPSGERIGPRARLLLLRQARLVVRSGLFDAEWYLLRYPDIAQNGVHPLWHWLMTGWREGREPNPAFDCGWYLEQYPDVASDGVNPLLHYLQFGAVENRSPSPLLDTAWYLSTYRDVAEAGMNPLLHFVNHGLSEGRNPHPLVDQQWYARQYPETAASGLEPLRHFLLLGHLEGRSPGPKFDCVWYLGKYADVAASGSNPLLHYLRHGRVEGRLPRQGGETDSADTRSGSSPSYNRPEPMPSRRFPGRQVRQQDHRNVLLCAHTGSGHLFGGERSFLDILELLQPAPFNLYVAVPHADEAYINALAERAVEVVQVHYRFWRQNEPPEEQAVAAIMALLVEHGIDLVHVNTMVIREPLIAARRLGVPTITHVRESVTADRWMSSNIGLPPASIIDAVNASTDCVIANSRHAAAEFNKDGKTFIVPNTFELARLDLPNQIDAAGLIRIGLVSSNIPKKGIEDFAELATACADEIPNLRFVLIGPETGHTAALREQQQRGEITDRLEFLGYQDTPELAMAQINLVANLSHFAESFGRTIAEGLAARRPALVYDLGAPKDLIQHGESGYIIPQGQWRQAVPLLKELCAHPERITEMGEKGRAFIAEHYGRDSGRSALLAAYDATLACSNASDTSTARRTAAARKGQTTVAQKLAYFCWHFPVPSETFVLNELRLLVAKGYDVEVFCKHSPHPDFKPDFPIRWQRVAAPSELAAQLRERGRTMVHAHFTYPTVTDMVWPACEEAGIPFTFIAHAQDIFKHENDRRNRVGELARSANCRAVFTLGRFHRDYLAERGVPAEKIIINPNSIDVSLFPWEAPAQHRSGGQKKVCAIHRLTEKKGLHHLIDAAAILGDDDIVFNIYGYGEDEPRLRALIEERDLRNVHLLGPLTSREAIIEVLRSHHLFACPSVRTANGDMDGIPTVLLESMAVGTPVLTTDVASIPDLVQDGVTGVVTPTGNADALAAGIRRFFAMQSGAVRGLSMNARRAVEESHDARRTTRTLERVWNGETVDLVIVSWNNLPELREVIGRIYDHTRTPFHLTVCDNASAPEVTAYLCAMHSRHNNLSVVFNDENSYVGPGTNIAAAAGQSDYIIYVCGKEGFVLAEAWEQRMVAYMDEHPKVGLAGTLGYSPSYFTGADMERGIPTFSEFRNPQFARDNPDRPFFHVQGGLFIMRRRMMEEIGGFSEAVPHAHTDVEYSYYAESCGWKLGQIPGMLALYNKTRPDFWSRVDEHVRVIHPPRLQDLPLLDQIANRSTKFCSVCGWSGPHFDVVDDAACCPSCASTPTHRALYRWLAESPLTFRGLPALMVNPHACLEAFWKMAFRGQFGDESAPENVASDTSQLTLALDRPEAITASPALESLRALARVTSVGGYLVVGQATLRAAALNEQLSAELGKLGLAVEDEIIYASDVVRYDAEPLLLMRRVH